MDKRYKTSIPQEAVERPHISCCQNELDKTIGFEYVLNDKVVGMRFYDENGKLEREYGLKDGAMHGREYDFINGRVHFVANWIEGKEHGTCKQYDYAGKVMQRYKMNHGTGLDLWRCNITGTLAEACYKVDGKLNGYEWFINSDQKSVWEERHCVEGFIHGIWRFWNTQGRFHRGFPQYFIKGQKVDKRRYIKACKSYPTLPPFRLKDNKPYRSFPPEVAKHLGVPEGFTGPDYD